jgi:hypothetical protein
LQPLPDEKVVKVSDTLYTIGYRYGIYRQFRSDSFAAQSLDSLSTTIPPSFRSQLRERDSPDPRVQVIHVAHRFSPEEAGAPVFNDDGKVVGLVIAGFEDIGWVMPMQDILLESVSIPRIQDHLNSTLSKLGERGRKKEAGSVSWISQTKEESKCLHYPTRL